MNAVLDITYRVFACELEQLIKEKYKIPMTVCGATAHVPGIRLEYQVAPICHTTSNGIRNGKRTRSIRNYLCTLAADGVIPFGRYVIDTGEPRPIAVDGKWRFGKLNILGIAV